MKITFYGTRDYDRLYFEPLAADPDYGCTLRFLAANLDADTAPLAAGGEAVCAFVNADCSAPVLEVLAENGIFIAKVFKGGAEGGLLADVKKRFRKVSHAKPDASRQGSPEEYLVAVGFKKECV